MIVTDFEYLAKECENSFSEGNCIYMPVNYGCGRLLYAFEDGKPGTPQLVGIVKDGEIYRVNDNQRPISHKLLEDNGYKEFELEKKRIMKEINDRIVSITDIPEEVVAEAKKDADGFLFRLRKNQEGDIHAYLPIKAILDLNAPVNTLADTSVEVFLGNTNVNCVAINLQRSLRTSGDFLLNVALYKRYSEEIESLNLTEKEKAILEAIYDKKDITVNFNVDGRKAMGHYSAKQIMSAYTEGFPPPAPKHLTWDNITEIRYGKKDKCVYRDEEGKEQDYEEER